MRWDRRRLVTRPHVTRPDFFTCMIAFDRPPRQLVQQSVCKTKKFCTNCPKTISSESRPNNGSFGVGKMLTFDGIWPFDKSPQLEDEVCEYLIYNMCYTRHGVV